MHKTPKSLLLLHCPTRPQHLQHLGKKLLLLAMLLLQGRPPCRQAAARDPAGAAAWLA
jgi:hypothetical protein